MGCQISADFLLQPAAGLTQLNFDDLAKTRNFIVCVIPAKTGIRYVQHVPGSGFRRSDGFLTCCRLISF